MEYLYKKDGVFEKRIKPLFPGYIFVITNEIRKFYDAFKFVDGFKKVLTDGEDFAPIRQEEADFIAGITDKDRNISLSEGYIVNSKIIVTSGPLLGREGIIKKIDRHKRLAYIEFDFMGLAVKKGAHTIIKYVVDTGDNNEK